jgi:putative phage-type endonuclease
MLNIILYNNYFKKHYYIKKMLINCKVDILTNKMKNLNTKNNLKINDDYYNDNTRNLDNLLYKYIKYDITLDQNDYKFLKKEHINDEFIINRVKLLKHNKNLLDKLLQYPYIEQCTDKWYEIRKTCLTASDLGEALSKNNNLLAKKKAGVYIDNTNFQSVPPLKWGNMFEDMAIRCYKQINNNIKIHKFGIIQNKMIEHFGASPDGITDLGIMVEIKCPFSRQIKKDFIPEKYYYQMQGQLAVCNLTECDYVECDFKTFDNNDEFYNFIKEKNYDNKNFGVIAEYYDNSIQKYFYLYSNEYLNKDDCIIDIKKQMENINSSNLQFIKLTKWVLNNIYIQKVEFDKELWDTIPPKIKEFWEKVESFKDMPIEYKETKKKLKFIEDS